MNRLRVKPHASVAAAPVISDVSVLGWSSHLPARSMPSQRQKNRGSMVHPEPGTSARNPWICDLLLGKSSWHIFSQMVVFSWWLSSHGRFRKQMILNKSKNRDDWSEWNGRNPFFRWPRINGFDWGEITYSFRSHSGQINRIPKPEWFGQFGRIPLRSTAFWGAEVAIIWSDGWLLNRNMEKWSNTSSQWMVTYLWKIQW